MLLVTGATGRIGGLVTAALKERGVRPRVLVRDAKHPALPTGVDVRVGDYADGSSLRDAMEGVEGLFLVSPVHPDQRQWQTTLAQIAAEAGVRHIVKLSGLATSLNSFVDSGRWHAETEQDIVALGLGYTFLRPYFFMQNLTRQLNSAAREGVVRVGAPDAEIAMIDARDIADVAAAALLGEASLHNVAVALTGSQAVTYRDVGQHFAAALGRAVRVEPQTPTAARAALARSGMPDWHQQILQQFNRAFAEGLAAPITDVVQRSTGHAPRSLQDFVVEATAALRRVQNQ